MHSNKIINRISKEYLTEEYFNKERTLLDISTELGCTEQAVWYWLKQFKIESIKKKRGEYRAFNGEISSAFWCDIKRHANDRKLDFLISLNEIWELFLKQDRKCNLSGVDIILSKNRKDVKTASLDRVDNSKGYIIDNVQWIHKDLNRMKWSLYEDDLLRSVKNIYEFNNSNDNNTSNYFSAINEKISIEYWCNLRFKAEKRKLDFLISRDYMMYLFEKQNAKCKISNMDISLSRSLGRRQLASVDRIDSSKGYIEGNVQWVHYFINQMKYNFTLKKFYDWVEIIYKFKKLNER